MARRRYQLPDTPTGHDITCIRVYVPDNIVYIRSFFEHLSMLAKWTAWEITGLGETDASEAAEIWRGLLADTMESYYEDGGCMSPYIVGITGACPDGTITVEWSDESETTIDLTCLLSGVTAAAAVGDNQSIIAGNVLLASLVAGWDGSDPTTINANAPETTFIFTTGESAAKKTRRDATLCEVCRGLVAATCEMELQRRNTGSGLVGVGLVVLGLLSFLLPIVGQILLAGLIAAIAVIQWAFSEVSDEVLGDEEAQEEVACCMYNYLRYTEPTQAYFAMALDDCCFGEGTEEAQLAGAMAYILAEEDVYVAFIEALAEGEPVGDDWETCVCDVSECSQPYFVAMGDAWGAASKVYSGCDGFTYCDSGNVQAVDSWGTLPGYCVAAWVPGWGDGYPRSIDQAVLVSGTNPTYSGLIWQSGGLQDWGAGRTWNAYKCGRLFAWWSTAPFVIKFEDYECPC